MNKAVIDIGNTRIKCALFNPQGELIESRNFTIFKEMENWLKNSGARLAMACTVGQNPIPEVKDIRIIELNHHIKLPFRNLYKTPETLGVDRIAAMAAAASIYPGKPVLVFDIGTCMTIDFMSPASEYKGGNISPGLEMRLRAMHDYTGKLPFASVRNATEALGDSTLAALANGAIEGMRQEIHGYVDYFASAYPGLVVVICGGDSPHFDKPYKYRIFAAPNFVLQGLYHLLLLNE